MNIKELNAINLLALRDTARAHGSSKAAMMYGCEPQVAEAIGKMSERRIRSLVEKTEVSFFGLNNHRGFRFWQDAANEADDDRSVDWELVTHLRSVLSIPTQVAAAS